MRWATDDCERSNETPWLTPDESCKRLKVSLKTFRRHVAPGLKRKKKIGSLWRYHVDEIDRWGEDGRPTSSRSEAMESGTSSEELRTGVVSIGPLERALAKRLLKGSR
jgi:excisionase family DNA binding protein